MIARPLPTLPRPRPREPSLHRILLTRGNLCDKVPRYRLLAAAELEPDVPGSDGYLIELGPGCPGVEGVVPDLGVKVGEAGTGWGEGVGWRRGRRSL